MDDDNILHDASHSDDFQNNNDEQRLTDEHDAMSVVVSPPPPPPGLFGAPSMSSSATGPSSAANTKRYRPAPAKTFQCRGYGECRMVFSRSEHLARHIRKHTGERPFTCHCGKQFSRLDNLRQHAQTVHADKQDQNDRMMQELTSLHASMTAASKGSAPRGKRAQQAAAAAAAAAQAAAVSNTLDGTHPALVIKQEAMSMRPGTSTGYEGGNGVFHHPSTSHWAASSSVDRTNSTSSTHSFRDQPSATTNASSSAGQSFRVPPRDNTQYPGQSFLAPSSTPFSFSLPDIADHTPTSRSRPGTGSGSRPATGTTLPPISTVVASSLSSSVSFAQPPPLVVPQQREQQHHGGLTSSQLLPLPTPSGFARRPSTASSRPGTAPASYYYGSPFAYPAGTALSAATAAAGVVSARPELSLSLATRRGLEYAAPPPVSASSVYGRDAPSATQTIGESYYEPTSPIGGYDSPFSFHAPASSSTATTAGSAAATNASYARRLHSSSSTAAANPRKRAYAGSDDERDGERSDGGYDGGDNSDGERDRERWYKYRGDVRPFSSSGGGLRPGTAASTSGVGGFSATAAAAAGGSGYEYGSESRPQSRRLSVMELCNDVDGVESAVRPLVPLSGAAGGLAGGASGAAGAGPAGTGASRPTTSSGLVLGAQQLALDDRRSSPRATASLADGGHDEGWFKTVFSRAEAAAGRAAPAVAAATSAASAVYGARGGGGGGSLSPSPSPSSVYGAGFVGGGAGGRRRGSVRATPPRFAYERGGSGRSVSPEYRGGGRYEYEYDDGESEGGEWRGVSPAAGAGAGDGQRQQRRRTSQSPSTPPSAPPSNAPPALLSSSSAGVRVGYGGWVRASASPSGDGAAAREREREWVPGDDGRGWSGRGASPHSDGSGSGSGRGERDDQVRAGFGMRVVG